jgi:ribonuclease R
MAARRRKNKVHRQRAGHDLEARVISALASSDTGPLKTKELARALEISATDYRVFRRLLVGLERAGKIYREKGHRYAVSGKLDLVTGTLSVTRKGDGFVRPDEAGDDVFVPERRLATAMDGDRVVARIERRPRGRSVEGSVIKVLDRFRTTVVGVYHRSKRVSYVSPLDVRLTRDVLVVDGDEAGAEDGQVVVVKIVSFGEGRVSPSGSVEKVLGDLSAPGVDVLAVAYGYGISLDFDVDVLAAADAAARQGSADAGPDRVDRTELLCFTIDPADAKDHDDALSVTTLENGMIEVGVHIADVGHFVQPDTPVDIEAFARGTSVYLVDRTIPMLPPVLSNQVCSLNPGERKLAVSVFMKLDAGGRVVGRRYERTTIMCRHALSYEQAQDVLDGAASFSDEVDGALRTLDERARRVRAGRLERGALMLDLPEARVVLDEDGNPVDIQRRERLETHRLIEDYMILANEVVANDMEEKKLSTMYRVHEPPAPEKLEGLNEILSHFGVKVPRHKALSPKDVQGLLEAVRGRDEELLVNSLILRSLKKARYHTENLGHFGLASSGYLHFTSPIRRYPDLVVHRVLTEALIHGEHEPYPDEAALATSAERCSARERAAEEAERASVALKKVEYMERYLGDTFAGRVSGVAAFGFFVTLDEVFVDGLVHVNGLNDDFYHFREKDYALVGERGGKRFRLGDRVEVQVARVDKAGRRIDFSIIRTL